MYSMQKNQTGLGTANNSSKSVEDIIYESGICVKGMIMNGKSESEMHQAANSNWKNGDSFDASILDGITRESIESTLVQSGNTLKRAGSQGSGSVEISKGFGKSGGCKKIHLRRLFFYCAVYKESYFKEQWNRQQKS